MNTASDQTSSLPTVSPPPVYNLTALVSTGLDSKAVLARAANLEIDAIEAATVRDALSKLVKASKRLIINCNESDREIPWIAPALLPSDSESRFVVPLHL